VFCQKPLGRTAPETAAVVAAAEAPTGCSASTCRTATRGDGPAARPVAAGEIGDVFAADLVFHNAYGPDKPWFRDPALSGGGCVIDLGHAPRRPRAVGPRRLGRVRRARLLCGGRPLRPEDRTVEDYAVAQLDFTRGVVATVACSWNLHAGRTP
jgi:predicted dehydrogenase